ILQPGFIDLTNNSIPPGDKVAGSYGLPQMIAFDFGVCTGTNELVPQLVEMQGFASLYGFQDIYPNILRKHFAIPDNYTQYLNGYDHASYTAFLRELILGGHKPENVILLEIEPHKQKTRVDFYCTRDITGVEPVCISELKSEGRKLYYLKNGVKTSISRIYNRVIFDELHEWVAPAGTIDIRKDYDVEWVTHPDWFYRISKYTLPFIQHPFVPETFFLNEIKELPGQLENYVLKPLFSFAGQGVVIDIKPSDIDNVKDPENWILQKKVQYADVIQTPEGPAKTEIRIMYLWKDGAPRPEPVINLARLSKGKMIGTRYNKDKTWVGGSVAFFER
ncbi:MAG: hypothetical protein J7497_08205, partial [Chitinophagaceae bacterium]|nr:hypothetical protein [Chitinophagaceae bacterium]